MNALMRQLEALTRGPIVEHASGCLARPGKRNRYWTVSWRQADGTMMSKRLHRHVYLELVGDIPEGMEIDHLCRFRPCVNPDHLEVVTRAENVRRATEARWSDIASERARAGLPPAFDLGSGQQRSFVRDNRKRLGLRQRDLSLALGVSTALVTHWETEVRTISTRHEAQLRAIFAAAPADPSMLRGAA